jgi:hypothetical protein
MRFTNPCIDSLSLTNFMNFKNLTNFKNLKNITNPESLRSGLHFVQP